MATEQQIQQMLDMMQQQMTTMNNVQAENTRLRDIVAATDTSATAATTAAPTTTTNTPAERRYKSKKPDRPPIETGLDDQEWVLFIDTWGRYKDMLEIPATDVTVIRNELRSACSNEVNKLLFEYIGATKLNACSEEQLLGYIKSVAVKVTHKAVHRVEFDKMIQNDGESITHYVSRLNAKAFLCKFEVNCGCNPQTIVSYAEERVSERLLAGLQNKEHQVKILNEAEALVTLDQKIERLQTLESTEDSTNSLHQNPPANAAAGRSFSTYNKKKKSNTKNTSNGPLKCMFCGRTSHGADKTLERIHCPAREKDCNFCHKKGHFADVCKKAISQAAAIVSQNGIPNNNGDNNNNDDNPPASQGIPSDSAVSFSFATTSTPSNSSQKTNEGQDFRRVWRPTVER